MQRKGTLHHWRWEYVDKLVQTLWKRVWRLLKELKIELSYNLAFPLLGIYLKKTKTLIQKETHIPMFTKASFTIAKTWKQPKCPLTEEQIKKIQGYYTLGYHSAIRKEILPYVTSWMNLQGTMLSEISQTEKDKHCMFSLICGI